MTQLIYHPAFDPYNALLRSIRVLAALPLGIDPLTLRILDFYLLFPERLINIRLTTQLRSAVRKLEAQPRYPYDRLPASRNIFERMASSFDAALQTMTARGLISSDEYTNHVNLRVETVPAELFALALSQNESEGKLMSILVTLAAEFPLAGTNGIKDRSGLAEYRYDVV